MPPKSKKETVRIKNFKDGSNNWWCSNLHYSLENNKLIVKAGGKETEESRAKMEAYLKRKGINYEK